MHLPAFGENVPMKDRRLVMGPATQALLPMKYKWLYDIFKKANNNFWLPEEIGMGEDKYNYTQLESNVRHFYDFLFSMLTTMDLIVTDALESSIMPWASAPEFRSWLALQGYQEAIHSHAYTLIAEEIAGDPDVLFGMYLTEKSLYDKIAMAYRFNEKIDQAVLYSDPNEAIQDFIIGYAFWAVMLEGVWFFLGLSIGTYPASQKRMMRGTADQFQYIRRDENLHYHTGISIIQHILKEYPDAWTPSLQTQLKDMVEEGLALERRFAEDALVDLPGLSVPLYMQECRYQAMTLMRRLGIDMYPGTKQALGWLTESVELRKESNFFERRSSEYQVGTNLWDEEEGTDAEGSKLPGWDDPVGGGW